LPQQRYYSWQYDVEAASSAGHVLSDWLRYFWGTGPDQTTTILIDCLWLRKAYGFLERLQAGIVKIELELQGCIGDTTPSTQECHRLIEHGIKVHDRSPLPR
jgi:hypothetical protein